LPARIGQDDKILEGETSFWERRSPRTRRLDDQLGGGFVDAGFKLEEARIKFLVLQEIGSPENQKIATTDEAINQLGKLIHDGKVAISGSPADSAVPSLRSSPGSWSPGSRATGEARSGIR